MTLVQFITNKGIYRRPCIKKVLEFYDNRMRRWSSEQKQSTVISRIWRRPHPLIHRWISPDWDSNCAPPNNLQSNGYATTNVNKRHPAFAEFHGKDAYIDHILQGRSTVFKTERKCSATAFENMNSHSTIKSLLKFKREGTWLATIPSMSIT